jgi:hypothetical protein
MKKTFRVKVEGEAYGASRAIGPRGRIADEPQHFRRLAVRALRSRTIDSTLSPPRPTSRTAKNFLLLILVEAHTLCQLRSWSEL